jgi:hypothetical protein
MNFLFLMGGTRDPSQIPNGREIGSKNIALPDVHRFGIGKGTVMFNW